MSGLVELLLLTIFALTLKSSKPDDIKIWVTERSSSHLSSNSFYLPLYLTKLSVQINASRSQNASKELRISSTNNCFGFVIDVMKTKDDISSEIKMKIEPPSKNPMRISTKFYLLSSPKFCPVATLTSSGKEFLLSTVVKAELNRVEKETKTGIESLKTFLNYSITVPSKVDSMNKISLHASIPENVQKPKVIKIIYFENSKFTQPKSLFYVETKTEDPYLVLVVVFMAVFSTCIIWLTGFRFSGLSK